MKNQSNQDPLLQAVSNVSGEMDEDAVEQLATVAQASGSEWAFGTIDYAGQFAPDQFAPGEYAVTFRIDKSSGDVGVHASVWPEWAYDIARSAFLADKRVLVTYESGQGPGPFGHTLQFVTLSAV